MDKENIIKIMRKWYIPNYFDLSIFDYENITDEEIYNIYLEELATFGDEIINLLKQHNY